MNRELTSLWGDGGNNGLHESLIATIYEVDRDGSIVRDSPVVKAPFIDSELTMDLNWQSPFENSGQSTLPTTQQLLQSGVAADVAREIGNFIGVKLAESAEAVEGRATITKLNSTQVFNGMPPFKYNVTLLLRAWKDPLTEVQIPLNQIMRWALPVKLGDANFFNRARQNSVTETIFPTEVPVLLAVVYKDCTYGPLVIESITKDTNAPSDENGNFVSIEVPIQFASLTAIDRDDWDSFQNWDAIQR